mmetsp:Transcript_102167/g.256094  ORF Transcript_102167/g.256094 Transcript_102167/m.256094 type:complete len:243 (+) Transcript_102167:983-1711(+)
MIEDEPLDEPRVGDELVLHVQDLHHVQIQRLLGHLDAADCVHDDLGHRVGDGRGDLRPERRPRHANQSLSVAQGVRHRDFEGVEERDHLLPGEVEALRDQPRVQPLGEASLGQLHQLPDEHDTGRGAVAGDVVLRRGGTGDHAGRGVLDLHLAEEHVAILSDLDLPSSAHQHLQGASGAEVGLHDLLKALGSVQVHRQGLGGLEHIGFGVDNGHHDARCYCILGSARLCSALLVCPPSTRSR